MDTTSIIAEIDAEIERLQKAHMLLSSIDRDSPPAKKTAKRRRMSTAARKSIADAQKKRWAKVRAAKKAAKTAPTKKAAKKKPAKKPTAKKPARKAAKKPAPAKKPAIQKPEGQPAS
jgi:hypothetical protein